MLFPVLWLFLFAAAAVAHDNKDLGAVLAGNKNLTKFYELIKKYPDVLLELPSDNGVTIIAPSDKAMANIPYTALQPLWDPEDKAKTMPILQYHILNGAVSMAALKSGPTYFQTTRLTSPAYTNVTAGQGVLINKQGQFTIFTSGQGARCTLLQADIPFAGGLLQVVDNLLVPPTQVSKTAEAFRVTSFLGSLYAAKLMPDIAYRKNVTIFAPQDQAYGLVGGTLQDLDAPKLTRIMNYHIIPDQVLSSALLINGTKYDSLAKDAAGNASRVTIRQDGNNKYVNTARIVQPDILLANGVMHIIGSVLNPDEENAAPNPDVGTQPPVFAVSTAAGVFTSALPCTTDCPVTTTSGGASGAKTTATTTAASTSSVFSSTSHGGGPRCTAHVVGAAVGMIGLGAGMAWM
ncbi:beta-Ig-H3/Fasciclin [Metarhizium rileyi]|uniref:Beta-Ig-H3/Fasciclin n=1 Tax=Metarhizium rileyi (strain RCEF 4871) TaxID=1649241 RepID=A0A167GTN7_METRR|nr:beta-Ig-H3/Fasciclin [Metarhizium rileyi RCEF 4871]